MTLPESFNLSQPYLFMEFWVPKRAPYNTDHSGWVNIVGDFIRPIMLNLDERVELAWMVQEGRHFQLCISTPWPDHRESGLRMMCKTLGFRRKRTLRGTAGTALCGDRWNEPRRYGTPEEQHRSVRLLHTLHNLCQLYVDSLQPIMKRKKRIGWAVEHNTSRQNPHHNHFESVMHLIANLSQARFDVQVQVKTGWMHEGFVAAKFPCHL